jgi:hypothetical protein
MLSNVKNRLQGLARAGKREQDTNSWDIASPRPRYGNSAKPNMVCTEVRTESPIEIESAVAPEDPETGEKTRSRLSSQHEGQTFSNTYLDYMRMMMPGAGSSVETNHGPKIPPSDPLRLPPAYEEDVSVFSESDTNDESEDDFETKPQEEGQDINHSKKNAMQKVVYYKCCAYPSSHLHSYVIDIQL